MALGKCHPCRIVFEWEGKPLVRNASCTRCGSPLRRTTTEKSWPRVRRTPNDACA